MTQDRAHRRFKDDLFGILAAVGKALGSPRRIELLELLAQGERSVEALADEAGLSVANASQHLLALQRAGLVERRKDGLFVHYRLADPSVYELCRAVRTVAERRHAALERLVRDHFGKRDEAEAVGMEELLRRARAGEVVILDTRPAVEYAAGHIAGALSVPIDGFEARLAELPKRKQYVAYCRGPYCIYADRAVDMLRASGRRAKRMTGGFPEWRAAGLPVASGVGNENRHDA